jgi:hypothetical protein
MNSVLAFVIGIVLGPIVAIALLVLVFLFMTLWHVTR